MISFSTHRRELWLGWLLFIPCSLWPQDAVKTPVIALEASSASQSSGQQVLSLDDVIREALEKSPEAQSALHAVRSLKRRVPQVKTLPDPMVSVGWAGNLTPFSVMPGDNSSYRGLTVSEQFPIRAS
jgi:outer membrane protein TolC